MLHKLNTAKNIKGLANKPFAKQYLVGVAYDSVVYRHFLDGVDGLMVSIREAWLNSR